MKKLVDKFEALLAGRARSASRAFDLVRNIFIVALFRAALFDAYVCESASGDNATATAHGPGAFDKQSCAKDKRGRTSYCIHHLSNAPKLAKIYDRYNKISCVLYLAWILKALAVLSLDLDALAPYRFIDCLLVGRLAVNPRSTQGANYVVPVITSVVLCYRVLTSRRFGALQTRFRVLEFILMGEKVVTTHFEAARSIACIPIRARAFQASGQSCEHLHLAASGDASRDASREAPDTSSRERHLDTIATGTGSTARAAHETECERWPYQDLFNVRANFLLATERPVIRLNRTPAHWRRHTAFFLATSVYMLIFVLFLNLACIFMSTPTIVTKRGFELAYAHCTEFLGEQSRPEWWAPRVTASLVESWGWSPRDELDGAALPQRDPFRLSRQNITPGFYHAARIIFDILQSFWVFFEMTCFIAAHWLFISQCCYDVILNARILQLHMCTMRLRRWHERSPLGQASAQGSQVALRPGSPAPLQLTALAALDQLNALETIRIQALLLDHFKTTTEYNKYISFQCVVVLLLWTAFTCTILLWLSISGSEAIHLEFFVAEISSVVLLAVYFAILSIVYSRNRQFYPLVVSLMALEKGPIQTKQRWINIVSSFHPKQSYSFSVGSSEISLLFVVKLMSWIFSALCVVLSFFYMRIGPK